MLRSLLWYKSSVRLSVGPAARRRRRLRLRSVHGQVRLRHLHALPWHHGFADVAGPCPPQPLPAVYRLSSLARTVRLY
jgi:hypothetical protein